MIFPYPGLSIVNIIITTVKIIITHINLSLLGRGARRTLRVERSDAYLFKHKLRDKKLWTGGYFPRTVGAVTAETTKGYVLETKRKHREQLEHSTQQTLLNCAEAAQPEKPRQDAPGRAKRGPE